VLPVRVNHMGPASASSLFPARFCLAPRVTYLHEVDEVRRMRLIDLKYLFGFRTRIRSRSRDSDI